EKSIQIRIRPRSSHAQMLHLQASRPRGHRSRLHQLALRRNHLLRILPLFPFVHLSPRRRHGPSQAPPPQFTRRLRTHHRTRRRSSSFRRSHTSRLAHLRSHHRRRPMARAAQTLHRHPHRRQSGRRHRQPKRTCHCAASHAVFYGGRARNFQNAHFRIFFRGNRQ